MRFIYFIPLFFSLCSFSIDTIAQSRPQRERLELYNTVEDASELKPGENVDEKIKKNFFLIAEVSKTRCFVGEAVMATFKAYSRLDANSQVVKRPSLSGFSVIEMVDAYNNQPDVEKFNGEFYYVHLIRKVQLFPLQPGDFTIEPAEVESVIRLRNSSGNQRDGLRLRDLFRREKSARPIQKQVLFKTPEVQIHVEPLPPNQPEDFSGAVGTFDIQMLIDDSTASQHEPSKITVNISGSGNFPLITDPEVQWPQNIDPPPASVNEDVNKYKFPLSGTKSFQYTIDNNDTGRVDVPPVSFTFFDPASASYKTVSSLPLSYTVQLSTKSAKTITGFRLERGSGIPIHYYYFGVVVLVIVVVIVYMFVKKNKN